MKEIKIIFEVEDNTDELQFENDLGEALDNLRESELDKCSGWRVGK